MLQTSAQSLLMQWQCEKWQETLKWTPECVGCVSLTEKTNAVHLKGDNGPSKVHSEIAGSYKAVSVGFDQFTLTSQVPNKGKDVFREPKCTWWLQSKRQNSVKPVKSVKTSSQKLHIPAFFCFTLPIDLTWFPSHTIHCNPSPTQVTREHTHILEYKCCRITNNHTGQPKKASIDFPCCKLIQIISVA